jgi:hypothetical protein
MKYIHFVSVWLALGSKTDLYSSKYIIDAAYEWRYTLNRHLLDFQAVP